MDNKMMIGEEETLRVQDVAQIFHVSESKAYKIIRQMNEELKAKGFYTISGRVSRLYFNERVYGRKESA